jgi:hypothetical protein
MLPRMAGTVRRACFEIPGNPIAQVHLQIVPLTAASIPLQIGPEIDFLNGKTHALESQPYFSNVVKKVNVVRAQQKQMQGICKCTQENQFRFLAHQGDLSLSFFMPRLSYPFLFCFSESCHAFSTISSGDAPRHLPEHN